MPQDRMGFEPSPRPNRKPTANSQLQPNPFMTYRDPQTGRWMVVKPLAEQPHETSLAQAMTMPPSMLITWPVM